MPAERFTVLQQGRSCLHTEGYLGHSLTCPECFAPHAGLGRPVTGVGIKYNRNSLRVTLADPDRVLDATAGRVLSITGYTRDAAARLNVCFQAPVRVC